MKIIIVDIDGVCFSPTARLERCKDADGNIDWERAFNDDEVIQDPPIKGAKEATEKIVVGGFKIAYMTGRSQSCERGTFWSLEKNRFASCIQLYMRLKGDTREDYRVKTDMIVMHRLMGMDEFCAAVDDDWSGNLRPMYIDLGIPHFYTFDELFQDERFDNKFVD